MEIINTILGVPLGFIIFYAYHITNNYGFAIIIFAVLVKIVLFPVMILAHKNSIRLLQLQPALGVIKARYSGDKARLNEEQYELFTKEKYSPLIGLIPLLIQLFLIMGMLQVMYHPLQHILRLDPVYINEIVQIVRTKYPDQGGFAPQLRALESVYAYLDLNFFGLNLGVIPSVFNPSIELIIPFISGIIAFIFCMVQNTISPGALSQSKRTNVGLTVFTVGLSLYFTFALPVGVGLYWTIGNFAAIVVVLFLNLIYPPKKMAAEALVYVKTNRKSYIQLKKERLQKKALSIREKHDSIRFSTAKKQIVFYALTGSQYRYYKNIIEYLLKHSDITIHYLTNDPNDKIFVLETKQLVPYYISQKKTISLMLKLYTDIMVTTVPNLHTFHMKRSVVKNNIEYIFIPHNMGSLHVMMRETACDHFDTIFCVGQHHVTEIRRREEIGKLPKKKLIKAGYGLYDQLILSYSCMEDDVNTHPKILIAPSWHDKNILELCIEPLLDSLLGQGYFITIRPHPQFTQLFPEHINVLNDKYASYIDIGELSLGLDISDNKSIFEADLIITDWSNIAFEFAYSTLKPCVFINTPMKVMNPNYEKYGLEIVDIKLRDEIGISIDVDNISVLRETIVHLLSVKDIYKERIVQIINQYLYHPGRNGEAGGLYIIQQLKGAN